MSSQHWLEAASVFVKIKHVDEMTKVDYNDDSDDRLAGDVGLEVIEHIFGSFETFQSIN